MNVVDCLALDNLNRIYSKVNLLTIKKTSVSLKKTIKKDNELQDKLVKSRTFFYSKPKVMNLNKFKKSSIVNLNIGKIKEYFI